MKVFILFLSLIALGGCASTSKNAPESKSPENSENNEEVSLNVLLESEQAMLADSEFSIVFPEENHPSIKTFNVEAKNSRIEVTTFSSRKLLKEGVINQEDYSALFAKLKQLDEAGFQEAPPHGCREPFNFKLRVGAQKRIFVGCRGFGPNSATISKLARELEYFLIKRTSG